MKKYLPIVVFFMLVLSSYLQGYFHFEEMKRTMTRDEWQASGLDALTKEEKQFFETWLVRKAHCYHFSIPIVDKKKKVRWVYEAKKRKPYTSEYDPYIYDEQKIPHNLAIFSLFQHEAKYVTEWIEYHLLLGVEHFYLCNNLSNDNYLKVLEPYINKGLVTLFQWPYFDPDGAEPWYWCEMQKRSYEMVIQRVRGKYRWLAIIDTDEFLVPRKKDSLVDFLKDYEPYGGVVVNWLVFGTSFVEEIGSKELMIEKLVKRFSRRHRENLKIKSIVKPHRVKYWPSPHWCEYMPGFYAVDPLHNRVVSPSIHNKVQPMEQIRINHYWFRTSGFYWGVKVPRWRTTAWQLTDEEFMLREAQSNKVTDTTIHRFIPKLKKQIKKRAYEDKRFDR